MRNKKRMKTNDAARFNLHIGAALKKRIKLAGVHNNRTMNGEIVARLERSFEPDPLDLRALLSLDDEDRAKAVELLRQLIELLSKTR